MTVAEKFQFVVNPPQKRWDEMVTQCFKDKEWKQSFHDYRSYLDGYGEKNFRFIVAIDKETDKLAACVCGALFPSFNGSPEVFTIGIYYVHPDHRGTGLGLKVFNELTEFGKGRNMFLNAVQDMTKKYADAGFDKIGDWEMHVLGAPIKDVDITKLEVDSNLKIVDLKDVDFANVEAYDQEMGGGVVRSGFLKKWLRQEDSWNKFAVDASGKILGLCHARIVCGNHVILGPFYADSTEIASTLMRKTLETVPDLADREKLNCYKSFNNIEGTKLFKSMVNGECFDRTCPRQFTQEVIISPDHKIYAIAEAMTSFY